MEEGKYRDVRKLERASTWQTSRVPHRQSDSLSRETELPIRTRCWIFRQCLQGRRWAHCRFSLPPPQIVSGISFPGLLLVKHHLWPGGIMHAPKRAISCHLCMLVTAFLFICVLIVLKLISPNLLPRRTGSQLIKRGMLKNNHQSNIPHYKTSSWKEKKK